MENEDIIIKKKEEDEEDEGYTSEDAWNDALSEEDEEKLEDLQEEIKEKCGNKRFRRWVFTINNYMERNCKNIEEWCEEPNKILYCIYQREIGGKTGTPHLQGFIHFKNKQSLKGVIKKLKEGTDRHPWLNVARGTDRDSQQYCSWSEKRQFPDEEPFEFGKPQSQGERTDIPVCYQIYDDSPKGCGMLNVYETGKAQAIKMTENRRIYSNVVREWKTKIVWIQGALQDRRNYLEKLCEGKARYYLVNSNKGIAFSGYDSHEIVQVNLKYEDDDFPLKIWRLIGGDSPCPVDVKYGSIQFTAKIVYVSCEHSPSKFWNIKEDIKEGLTKDQIENIQKIKLIDEILEI